MNRQHEGPHFRRALRAFAFGAVAVAAISTAACKSSTSLNGYNSIVITNGDNQSALKGTALANPLVVHVTGAGGIGAVGVPVTWTVATGGGTLFATAATTDADGYAQTRWTLGATAGAQTLRTQVAGLAAVTFDATATP